MTLITLPVDQWAKLKAEEAFLIHADPDDSTIYQGRREELLAIPGESAWLAVYTTYVRNHGASWGIMRALPETLRIPVLLVSGLGFSVGLLMISVYIIKSRNSGAAYCLVTMVAGSLGNLWDRIQDGYVTDFLSVRMGIGTHVFAIPNFNIADIIIVMSLICFVAMIQRKKDLPHGQ